MGEGSNALLFLLAFLAARLLSVEEWGVYRTAFAFVGLFRLLPDLGMSYATTLSIARDRGLATSLIGNLLGLQGVLSVLTFLIAMAIGGAIYERGRFDGLTLAAVAILTVDLLLKSVKSTLRWLLKAFERFGTEAASLLVERLALFGATLAALLGGGGVLAFVTVFAIVRLLDTSGLWAFVTRRVSPLRPQADTRVWLDLVRRGLPFAYSGAMVTLFFQVDQVLLKVLRSAEEVGYYATPVLVVEGLTLVPRILGFALIPTMAALHLRDTEALTALYRRAAKYLLLAGAPVAVFGIVSAEPFILLLFGAKYAASVSLTRILLPAAAFMFLSNLCETTLACVNRWRTIVVVSTVAAVTNVILNLIWIPGFGATGAAWATLVTEALYFVASAGALARHGHALPWLRTALRPALATLVFAIVLWWTRPLPVLISGTLASLAYLAATLPLGVWDARERSLVLDFLRRRGTSAGAGGVTS